MDINQIFDTLKAKFEDKIISITNEPPSDPFIEVTPEAIVDISLELRDNPDMLFDYLMCLSAMDFGDSYGVVYHLNSIKHGLKLVLKVKANKENPVVPTVERVWRTADWHEREAYDMMGIVFEGHHNPIRILCPYDWEGFPLRKDYKEPDEYHGIKVPY